MKEIRIVKREAMFIPIQKLNRKLVTSIKEKLSFKFYKEKACKDCEWLPEKHCDVCESCPAYTGGYELASSVKVGDSRYLKVPIGSFSKIQTYLEHNGFEIEIVNKAKIIPIKPVKFTGTLHAHQTESVEVLAKKKRGVLKAPPRSGKTVVGAALVCRLQKKTLLLASQRDWLMGFKETFVGSKTQKPLTDLHPNRIKLCKTLEDFQTTDIAMATIQTFYSEKGQKLLEKLRDSFTTIIADEIQTAAADKYIKILAKFNAARMYGVSGTPQRKDSKEVLVDNVLGPIIHEVEIERLRPHVKLSRTKYYKSYKMGFPWARMVSAMENDRARLKVIATQAIKDINDGHMVLIPMAQVKPIAKLVLLINTLAGKRICYPFTGKENKETRDLTIQRAREYKIKCLVGTTKIISVGINIPRASCLYEQVMSSNLPGAEQRFARVLTPMEDKPPPVIRYFLDDFNVRKNCMRNEYFNVLIPKYKPIVSPSVKDIIADYFKGKEQGFQKFDL